MRKLAAAALLLLCASLASAQSAPSALDAGTATPLAGSWAYATIVDGSESTFRDSASRPQLWLKCSRATRRISISRPAGAAVPALTVWTSSATRTLPVSFNPATARVTAELAMMDPILDGMAYSRGRIGVGIAGQAALVVPSWEEVARVVEDCRT